MNSGLVLDRGGSCKLFALCHWMVVDRGITTQPASGGHIHRHLSAIENIWLCIALSVVFNLFIGYLNCLCVT
jgi:hypothetical protein